MVILDWKSSIKSCGSCIYGESIKTSTEYRRNGTNLFSSTHYICVIWQCEFTINIYSLMKNQIFTRVSFPLNIGYENNFYWIRRDRWKILGAKACLILAQGSRSKRQSGSFSLSDTRHCPPDSSRRKWKPLLTSRSTGWKGDAGTRVKGQSENYSSRGASSVFLLESLISLAVEFR